MYPGMIPWLRARRFAAHEAAHEARAHRSGCHGGGGPAGFRAASSGPGDVGGGAFGVRRPLRFLARRLELTEDQVVAFGKIVADLKTERAQADVDDRRTIAAFADSVAGAAFDTDKARAGADRRVASAEQLRDAVIAALRDIHAVLDDTQRAELAHLIRTGTLTL